MTGVGMSTGDASAFTLMKIENKQWI